MKRSIRALMLAGAIGCTIGCNDDFSQGWRIDKTRVLGARASVEGDPTRASPAPGESFRVDWFVVGPGGNIPTTFQFTACRQADLQKGRECDGPAITTVTGTDRVPAVTVTTPPASALGTATHLLLWGDIDKTNVDYSVMLQTAEQGTNRNPKIQPPDIRIGTGAPWTVEDGACETLPQFIADDGTHDIILTTRDADREPVGDGREDMQLSHFTTAGKLDRLYSTVDGTEPAGDREMRVPWKAERIVNPPAQGLVVRFYFGLRDSRGGMDFTSRALCLRPQV